jgi:hypothetical protein
MGGGGRVKVAKGRMSVLLEIMFLTSRRAVTIARSRFFITECDKLWWRSLWHGKETWGWTEHPMNVIQSREWGWILVNHYLCRYTSNFVSCFNFRCMPNHIVECPITLNTRRVFLISGLDIVMRLACVALQPYRERSCDKKGKLFFGSVMVSMSCQL